MANEKLGFSGISEMPLTRVSVIAAISSVHFGQLMAAITSVGLWGAIALFTPTSDSLGFAVDAMLCQRS